MNFQDIKLKPDGKFHTYTKIKDMTNTLTQQRDLTFISINIRSLRKHWDTFNVTIEPILNDIDIIILTETNITNNEVELYTLPGFKSEHKCRTNGNGGGILFLYRSFLNAERLDINITSAELLPLKISNDQKSITILTCYRPPDQNVNSFNQELDTILNSTKLKTQKNIMIIGDINICYLKESYGWSEYLNVLYGNGLINTILDYTRVEIRSNTITKSCIDHINLKLPNHRYNSFVIQNKIADHYFIGTTIEFHPQRNTTTDIKKSKIEIISNKEVNKNIRQENWWPLLDLEDPEKIYETLTEKFKHIYNKSKIKIKTKDNNTNKPWITKDIQKLIEEKMQAWHELKKDFKNSNLKDKFKKLRNRVTQEIRKARNNHYFQKATKSFSNPRKSWNIVNELINKKKTPSIRETIHENFKIKDEKQILDLAEKFNHTFENTVANIHKQLQDEKFSMKNKQNPGNHNIGKKMSMNFKKLKEHNLSKIMTKLNKNSSAGPDNIRPKDVKENYGHLKLVLIHLINRIIKTGIIPKKMKVTHLRPIYKNSTKNNTENYRPIGSVSIIMKILEHHINNEMKKYVTKFNIISDTQFGFMPKKSTTQLLELMTNDINKALDENRYIVAVSLDLSKAFDIVDYPTLIYKLEQIGIRGTLLQLLKNYCKDRTICVSIGNTISSPKDQKYGLIQGSILSPLLFNIYVNDISSLKLRGKILQYADDHFLMIDHTILNTAIKDMQHDLDLVVKYFYNNSIKQNTNKTKLIIFKSPKKQMPKITPLFCHTHHCFRTPNKCDCKPLQTQHCIRHLGLELDSDMKYRSHISKLIKTLRKVLYQSYKLNETIPVRTKRVVYFSLIESLLRYAITMYYNAPQYILQPLINLVERIKYVLFKGLDITLMSILPFQSLAKYVDLTTHYFNQDLRTMKEKTHDLRLQQYETIKPNNNYGKALLEYKIPTLLNSLPETLRNLETPYQVKYKLKLYHLQNKEN